MPRIIKPFFPLLLLCCCFTFCRAQDSVAGYHLIRYIHVGGNGGWDYITANNGHLYLAHDSIVNVVDEQSGDSVGTITGVIGAHGIAFANGKGYATAGRINSVIVFDQATNKVTGKIKTAAGPDAIMYEPFSKRIFVCCGRAGMAMLINPATGKVTDSIALGGKPEEPASDEAGNIYVNLEDKNEVAQISAKTFKVLNRWPAGKGESPGGLAIDRQHHLLFITCDNKLMVVMDATNGKVLAELPTGHGTDGAAFDAGTGYAFSPNGEGTLTIIHEDAPDKFTVAGNLPTKPGARTIALDAETHHLFMPTAEFGQMEPAAHEKKRPPILPGSFMIVEVGR